MAKAVSCGMVVLVFKSAILVFYNWPLGPLAKAINLWIGVLDFKSAMLSCKTAIAV